MNSKTVARAVVTGGILLLALAALGCGEKVSSILVPNQLPTVQITAAPIDTNAVCDPDPVRSCYSIIVNWVGYDPDGRVDNYLYAIDPPDRPDADTVWISTRANEQRLLFQASTIVNPTNPAELPRLARDFHVFVIKAVDNRGSSGPLVARAFFSFTEAPTIQIISPLPNDLLVPLLTPSVRFQWSGTDDDGVFTAKPVKYKYILLTGSSEFALQRALLSPNSLRDYYAPNFFGWDSTSAETTEVQFTNLTPDQEYMFVVVAFDEAGAFSPIFTTRSNMLHFRVGYAGQLGPKITCFNEFFEYSYRGGYCPCPQAEVFIEVPAGRKINMNWFATPPEGASMRAYRWAVDIADVFDDTPRTDENTDLARWSSRSLNTVSASLGPYSGAGDEAEIHRIYIEAEDNVGLKSLAIIRFQVVRATFAKPLLIVDDTRLRADGVIRNTNPPCTARPNGIWPMAAELDTFLYARGGVPWQCYTGSPLTTPGIFNGYEYDTLGTRNGKKDLSVRLSALGAYQHVVWIIDGLGATNASEGTNPQTPQTALRYMSGVGRFSSLGAYVKQGGKVWLVGGGGAFATTIPWDDRTNNFPTVSFKQSSTRRELVPGRFMYDLPHWQQDIRVSTEVQGINQPALLRRYLGRYEGVASRPGYMAFSGELPATLERKVAATDPAPPTRTTPSDFYRGGFELEFLQNIDNSIVENTSLDPDTVIEESTLDTLYEGRGGSFVETSRYVLMTYYHGPGVPQGFVFSGFNIWSFQRAQCKSVVDFVLKRVWGLGSSSSSRHSANESRFVAPRVASPATYHGPGRITAGAPASGPDVAAKTRRRPGSIAQP